MLDLPFFFQVIVRIQFLSFSLFSFLRDHVWLDFLTPSLLIYLFSTKYNISSVFQEFFPSLFPTTPLCILSNCFDVDQSVIKICIRYHIAFSPHYIKIIVLIYN